MPHASLKRPLKRHSFAPEADVHYNDPLFIVIDPTPMPHMTVGDCSLYYSRHGAGEPLLLISGYLCDHVYWRAVTQQLSRHYQVICFDNRGVGQSTLGVGIHSTLQMAEDTLQLIEQLGLGKVSVLGHSMGGMIAHQLSLLALERIKHLILYSTRPYILSQSAFYMKTYLALNQGASDPTLSTRLMLPWVMSERFFEKADRVEQLLELAAHNPYPLKPIVQQQQYEALLKHDLRNQLTEIRVPTTLVMGDCDLLVPVTLSRAMAEQIPMARYHLIEGAAHSWHLEEPQAFVKTLLPILSEVL